MAGSFAAPAQMMSTIVCYMALANDPSPLFDTSAHDPAAASPECTPEIVTGETSEAGINAAAPARAVATPAKPNLALAKDANVAASKRTNVAAPAAPKMIVGASSKSGKPRSIKTNKSSP
jgi:hypothetical protein